MNARSDGWTHPQTEDQRSLFRVGLPHRVKLARLCEAETVGLVISSLSQKVGLLFYRWAAKRCLAEFRKIPQLTRLLVKGGSLHHCVPAISDIDMLLCYRPGAEIFPLLESVYRTYLWLKRRFPILGELILVEDDEWTKFCGNGHRTSLQFSAYFHLTNRRRLEPISLPLALSAQQRFNQASLLYFRAFNQLSRLGCCPCPEFRGLQAKRDFLKVIRVAGSLSPARGAAEESDVAADAFLAMERAASLARPEKPEANSECHYHGSPESIPDSGFRLLKQTAAKRLCDLSEGRINISAASPDRCLIVTPAVPGENLKGFLALWHKKIQEEKEPLLLPWVLVGPEVHARFREGLGMRLVLENHTLLHESQGNRAPDFWSHRASTMRFLREQWREHYHRVLGDLLSLPPLEGRENLTELYFCTLILATRTLTTETARLIALAPVTLKECAAAFARLMGPRAPDDRKALIALCVPTLSELRDFARSLERVGDKN